MRIAKHNSRAPVLPMKRETANRIDLGKMPVKTYFSVADHAIESGLLEGYDINTSPIRARIGAMTVDTSGKAASFAGWAVTLNSASKMPPRTVKPTKGSLKFCDQLQDQNTQSVMVMHLQTELSWTVASKTKYPMMLPKSR